ncbi:MAG TPA: alkaline phosphatase family protein, partial [Armatimonadota bacterium]|nr:alkaline phosphatase family protein [Armatimonadota bacterium]
MRIWSLLFPALPVLAFLSAATTAPLEQPYLHAPALDEYARHDPEGVTILPNGRFLKPAGRHVPVARWPHGLLLARDSSFAFVASDGVGQIVTDWNTPSPLVTPLPAPVTGAKPRHPNGGALALTPDGTTLYWSSGESGSVHVVDMRSRKPVAEISVNVQGFEDSFVMDLQLSADGRYLYCADVTNFRLAIIDAAERKVLASIPVGRYPYALAVAGERVYVANIGMFEYEAIPEPEDGNHDKRGLTFPPFGFPSKEAREGVKVEGRRVPGLGDPNVPASFSVWGVDVSNPAEPRVVARIKTGLLVGAPAERGKAVGGSAPNFLTAHGDSLYVSNGNNDMVERIDLKTHRIAARARIRPSPLTAALRGVGPSGMAVSPDGRRLYVAESGINAIAVLETRSLRVLGHIPTAWYPYRVALSPDGSHLLCISFKGFGNGPSAGKEIPRSPFLGIKGVLSVIPVPPDWELDAHTRTVLECNGIVDRRASRASMTSPVIPPRSGEGSDEIRHVVFITKENHTYDTIFDRIPGAKHDPSLLRWGLHQRIAQEGQPTLDDVAVMTNHNALARQFTVSDNFYMEPEASGVGHRWLVGVQPNNFAQMTYTLGWRFKAKTTAPGRRASFGSNGSIAPEDYPEAGSMWEHLARHRVPFRNYGEGFEFAGVDEGEGNGPTGAREVVNIPMSKVLFDNTCREFPIFNMNIPDQYRADWFIRDFNRLFVAGKAKMPSFTNIAICNDHGDDPKPDRGYPYLASWMADNDLALGRIIEFLSHTPYWRNMAIFVTQDDSGGEPDHVDAQRSVLLVISPWARRAYVSHRHTTIVSMHRTLYQILGLPPLNMFDALASDFSDCFTSTPDFT